MERVLPVEQVRVGMFVVELDRPWLDTPFLLQGFLIQDERALAQLRAYCKHVTVDAVRSTVPVGLDDLAPARQERGRDTAPVPAPRERDEGIVVPGSRGQWLEQILNAFGKVERLPAALPAPHLAQDARVDPGGRLLERLRGWFGRSRDKLSSDTGLVENQRPQESKRAYGTVPLETELGPAHDRFVHATEVFTGVIAEIRAGKGLELKAVETVVENLVDSIVRNPEALQLVARLRESDESAYTHALQVAVLMVTFGREIGFSRDELEQLGQIGMLLDIGKMRVRAALLQKTDNLTSEEFDEIKRHVELGMEMISASGKVHPNVMNGVRQHHERLDGSGYPDGLKDKQIGTFGRMAGIVDCFSAMTSLRPYADAISPYEAMRQLQHWSDRQFNSGLVQQFIQAIGIFPVGTLVELSSGESAVVIEQHKAHRLKPKVLIVADANGEPISVPIILDLLYGTPPEGKSMPYIRRGLAADSVAFDSAEFYLARV